MLTKSVKSVISVVLKHVARAKKIRAISVIREHLYYVCILAAQLRFAAFNCKLSAIISEWFYWTAIIVYPDARRVAPIRVSVLCLRFFAACFRRLPDIIALSLHFSGSASLRRFQLQT